jgi:hypothetical protein
MQRALYSITADDVLDPLCVVSIPPFALCSAVLRDRHGANNDVA